MPVLAAIPSLFTWALLTACAMAVACAVLSVFVVSRRWAFVGEGISHSGFGGAGTAWLLMLIFPALDSPERQWVPYAGVIAFSFITALLIGYLSRSRRVSSDTAIGIFMVGSLAWGFVAQQMYRQRRGRMPAGWETFLFGQMTDVSARFALAAALVCAAVVLTVAVLGKEILYYCLDPAMAEASGVRAGFIHYLLMLLVALTIVLGVRVAGNVLVTALLVLPGATALLLTQRLRTTVLGATAVGLLGALGGILITARWPFLQTGPAIVLVLFSQFVVAYAWAKLLRVPVRSNW